MTKNILALAGRARCSETWATRPGVLQEAAGF